MMKQEIYLCKVLNPSCNAAHVFIVILAEATFTMLSGSQGFVPIFDDYVAWGLVLAVTRVG